MTIPHRRTSAESGSWAQSLDNYRLSCETQERQAARVVAGQATDVEDCRELLAMLGLAGPDPG